MGVINKTQPMREAEIDVVDYINGSLTNKLAELDATDAKLREDLTTETSQRQDADNTLQNNINAEATARQDADNVLQHNINNEIHNRADADNKLQQNIDAEATARQDADNTLQANIGAEVTARENADTQLQSNIDAEAGTRSAEDAKLTNDVSNNLTKITALENKFPVSTDNMYDKAVTVDKLSEDLQTLVSFCKTLPDFEFGYSDAISIKAGSAETFSVTFTSAKSEVPAVIVSAQCNSDTNVNAKVKYVTTTGAAIDVYNNGTADVGNVTIDYLVLSGR